MSAAGFIIGKNGGKIEINSINESIYLEAKEAKKSVPQLINSKFGDDYDASLGTPFAQLCASHGLTFNRGGQANPFGFRSPTIAEVMEGKSGIGAASSTNTQHHGTPFGTQSRSLFPAAIIAAVEAQVQVDRTTDTNMWNGMVAQNIAIGGDVFEQPVLNYNGTGGPQQVKHQRIAQLSETPTMLVLTTNDRFRRLPTYGMGIEISDQAAKATSIDLMALTVGRYMQVEHDQRVYNFLNSVFAGDNDMCIGAIPSVTSTSLDSNATGGVLTHKAWVKFLARNRKRRRITHIVGDIDTYLKIEGRIGRPGLSAYDPRLSVIDPQGVASNVSFGSDVKYFIVDSAADGGPVPANTVWALDASQAITQVTNTEAEYQATQEFVLRRSKILAMHWSSEVFRLYGDLELTPFDVLTIA